MDVSLKRSQAPEANLPAVQKMVLVLDGDLSSYKAIARMGLKNGYGCLHFSNRSVFMDWVERFVCNDSARNVLYCVVFDAEFIDVFRSEETPFQLLRYPRICIGDSSRLSALVDLLKAGVFDLLEKPFRISRICAAIESAFFQYDDLVSLNCNLEVFMERFSTLTHREMEVWECLAKGLSVKQISARLGVSAKTVYAHRTHLVSKMGVSSVSEVEKLNRVFMGRKNPVPVFARQ